MSKKAGTDWGAIAIIAGLGIGAIYLMSQRQEPLPDVPGGGFNLSFPIWPGQGSAFPSLPDYEFPVRDLEIPTINLPGFPTLNLPTLNLPAVDLPAVGLPTVDLPTLNLPGFRAEPGKYDFIQGSILNVAGEEYGVVPRIPGVNISPGATVGRILLDALNPFKFGLIGGIARWIHWGSPVVDIKPISEFQQEVETLNTPFDSEVPEFIPAGVNNREQQGGELAGDTDIEDACYACPGAGAVLAPGDSPDGTTEVPSVPKFRSLPGLRRGAHFLI